MMVSLLFNHVIISLLVSFALSSDDGAIFLWRIGRTVLAVFFHADLVFKAGDIVTI